MGGPDPGNSWRDGNACSATHDRLGGGMLSAALDQDATSVPDVLGPDGGACGRVCWRPVVTELKFPEWKFPDVLGVMIDSLVDNFDLIL